MKTKRITWESLATLMLIATAVGIFTNARTSDSIIRAQEIRVGDFRISGPYAHKNLTIFLIQGRERWTGRTPLTLQEALNQNKVIVHETGAVQELSVENVSTEHEVYIQSGDIVKGGKQDRLLVTDLVIPPRSGKTPIAAFCVEPGRWSRRGKEAAEWFASSDEQLPSKDLKLAARAKGDQHEVWAAVGTARERMAQAAGVAGGVGSGVAPPSVAGVASSSLPMMLEVSKVRESAEDYTKALARIVDNSPEVLGYAFAINGKFNSADMFSSRALFNKMWPKLLKASAIEAMSDYRKDAKSEPIGSEAVKRFLQEAEAGAVSERTVTNRIRLLKKETKQTLLFETWDRDRKDFWIHRSYLAK